MATRLEVTSELYAETDFATTNTDSGTSISKFTFVYPAMTRRDSARNSINNGSDSDSSEQSASSQVNVESTKSASNDVKAISYDADGDAVVERKRKGLVQIEHQKSTQLDLVGLQIWRGALLLADYILHNEKKFKNKKILELGSGVGLTSIVASMYAREVLCTDIDVGGILELIRLNVNRNLHLKSVACKVEVTELDFKVNYDDYPEKLKNQLKDVDFVIAADVIYDDTITEAFVVTLERLLLELPKLKTVYIALEKRYVFTIEDMDSVAPSYEHFLRVFHKRNARFGSNRWKLMQVGLNFPRYFEYEKLKDLVLLKISN
ncbi:methyltransferase-like protein 22 [Uranotaenia lowii]|uniref:methyltransferase-like protein 22 n=1 Tax=Uranotaenia lowii TaxID=190385 RepID=UPI00247B1FDC|nr:methyltransferase-like protein 22 [Uranotaenia lowii]XP_055588678.1 methyltransferase-like protein 22 [Uranotaenia lowii]